jgi:hypothetical protein
MSSEPTAKRDLVARIAAAAELLTAATVVSRMWRETVMLIPREHAPDREWWDALDRLAAATVALGQSPPPP